MACRTVGQRPFDRIEVVFQLLATAVEDGHPNSGFIGSRY